MIRRLSPGLVLCAALAGCGGGGGSGSALLPPTGTASAAAQTVSLSIAIPGPAATSSAVERRPLYVSANTGSAAVAIDGGTAVITSLKVGAPGCTAVSGGGRTCTVSVSAMPGNRSFAVTLYASSNGTGSALSQNTVPVSIVTGAANIVNMTLDGVVASIVLKLANPTPAIGTAATTALTVGFDDASGAAIIGNDSFANPVTLTDSDTSGATTISKTALTSPADAANLTVAYTGAAIAQAVIGATSAGVPSASVSQATLTPQQSGSNAFVDWSTYGYDTARSGYNPYTTAITPASIANLHVAWQVTIGGATQTQPIVATNIAGHQALLIIGNFAVAKAYDALTGALVWKHELPTQDVQDCGIGGISGTPVYDKALGAVFMAAGKDYTTPNHVELYRLDVATGNITGQVDVTPSLLPGEANYAHSGVTFANGRIYLGTGSDCEGTNTGKFPSWRGRVVSVDPNSMTLLSTFYSTWGQGANYGGGGVWSWGGVSSDSGGNIYVATGNGETSAATGPQPVSPPFVPMPVENNAYAEHLVKLSADLSVVEGANFPGFDYGIGGGDIDYAGTPVIFQPAFGSGCGVLSATQGKGGTLVVNNTANLSELTSFKLSVPSGRALYIGNPGYSPKTGYLYAAITSSGAGSSMLPPGLAAIGSCGSAIAWNTSFGPDSTYYNGENPRSAPTVTAGGVVFMGTPCTDDTKGGCGAVDPNNVNGALWAIDGTTGSLLGNGKPLVVTKDNIRMAPSADGSWVWLLDDSGNMYGLTVDTSVKAAAKKTGVHVTKTVKFRAKE